MQRRVVGHQPRLSTVTPMCRLARGLLPLLVLAAACGSDVSVGREPLVATVTPAAVPSAEPEPTVPATPTATPVATADEAATSQPEPTPATEPAVGFVLPLQEAPAGGRVCVLA
jgi:hypothetical protein